MYVRGMSAAPAMRPGARVIHLPVARRRGFGLIRGLGLSCPAGQTPTNMYDGSVKCCGGPTPESDPCSYLNTANYQATQAAAQQQAIQGAAGPQGAALLQSIENYPQNVQQDAIDCVSNPGATFTDAFGMQVTCPAPSTSPVPGINVSIYTPAQIAAMIAGQSTPAPAQETPINLAGTTYTPPGSFAPQYVPPLQTGGPSLAPVSKPTPAFSPTPAVAPAPSAAPAAPSTPASGSDIGSQISSALTSNVSLGGFNLPLWGLAAAGLAALWFLKGKG